MITIVDYNIGNLGSILNMFRKIGHEARLSSDPQEIQSAEKLLLPGVGAFDAGMHKLERSGLIPVLNRRVLQDRVPTLGICLGMQLMARSSEEGCRPGLGWINAQVLRFDPGAAALKIPHMGWNVARPLRPSALTQGLSGELRFYFVHSYYVRCQDTDDAILGSEYGCAFHSGFQHENVFGVQFHPEKSHRFGMVLLRNFAAGVR